MAVQYYNHYANEKPKSIYNRMWWLLIAITTVKKIVTTHSPRYLRVQEVSQNHYYSWNKATNDLVVL